MKTSAIKRIVTLILAVCVLITAFLGIFARADELEYYAPQFSREGGIYTESFSLTIDGGSGDVYYTLDGSIPDETSTLYTEPIEIKPVRLSPRTVQGKVAQERYEKGIVVRAVTICEQQKSEVVTNTYFVSDKIASLGKNVPVVALSADPYDFWDGKEGIYTNYEYEHNITGYVEYFDNNGEGFERSLEMKVSGHGSRSNAKKSIRLYFTKGDTEGRKNLEYNMIEGTDKNFYNTDAVKKYGKVTFRISDWTDTDLKDPVAQKITEFMRPDTANSTPAALFLNGEFWGIYEAREQYDNRYLDYHYEDIGKDDVVFLDRDWTTENEKYILSDNGYEGIERILYEEGPSEDEEYYRDQFNYVSYLMRNAEDEDVYKELSGYVDIDNLIDYLFVCFYCDNIDWPGNNFKFWRTTMERTNGDVYAADGKWRFMVHDFDLAFDGVNNNTMEYAIKSTLPETEPRHPMFVAETFDGLFENEEFRNKFAQRAMAYLNTAVSVESVTNIVEGMIADREEVKAYDLLRWNNQSGTTAQRLEAWKTNTLSKYVNFATGRNTHFEKMVSDFYKKYYKSELGESVVFNFEIDSDKASIDIDGAVIRKSLYGDKAKSFTTTQYTNVPLTITAECKDGYYVKSITINGEKYDSSSVCITPVTGNEYKVTFEIAEGSANEKTIKDITVMRKARFEKMSVGEKLPVEVIATYTDGSYEKVFGFELLCGSDVIEIGDNGIITANKAGMTAVNVNYQGVVKTINIIIK